MKYSPADIARLKGEVEDAEQRVVTQEGLIERLKIHKRPTDEAEMVLWEMRGLLTAIRGMLAEMTASGAAR